jgi:hypothetical protein
VTGRLPQFLLIGAMKAGSTTLYEDLRAHPRIFLPEKELGLLAKPGIDAGQYARHFLAARPDQVVGEASTSYAKLPESAAVVDRAAAILGSDVRIIYSVRNPVDRTVSHHFHRLVRHQSPASIDDAVRTDPRLIDYSCYGMQLRPWVDLVDSAGVGLVHFERYVADRQSTLAELSTLLRIPPWPANVGEGVFNRTDGRKVAVGAVGDATRTRLYRRYVRPHLPPRLRSRLARRLLPKPPPRPAPPSEATVELILERAAEDHARLVEMFGAAAPAWDADETRTRYRMARAAYRVEGDGPGSP